ncbi:nicotinate-nucleotide adenylyltransferase [Ferrimonas sediminum]|uniref:Probable nicotinate-nucleotide adenylyltransferase n=1 Tax=Ferrimonas sediminum TaxID=718193 RepID=A0A1G8QKC9_9GAMM|nr:nicotinate-nucleotide adenylyltransferase [Ferrimonas sediminum]SDJ05254.1 nicotinate-nucleotide adenylyltransferase [Ferrimonas sediminum]
MSLTAIGLLGGTFDPIHNGHLKMATDALAQFQLDEVRLLPNHQPPHKAATGASSEQRLQMVRLACGTHPQLSVDDRELHRRQPSYTVDTLESLRQDHPHAALCFIIGMDSLNSFAHWHRPQRILELAHLIVCRRQDVDLNLSPAAKTLLKGRITEDNQSIRHQLQGQVVLTELQPPGVSSTEIRHRLQQGLAVDTLLPPAVINFIQAQRLYFHGVSRSGRV